MNHKWLYMKFQCMKTILRIGSTQPILRAALGIHHAFDLLRGWGSFWTSSTRIVASPNAKLKRYEPSLKHLDLVPHYWDWLLQIQCRRRTDTARGEITAFPAKYHLDRKKNFNRNVFFKFLHPVCVHEERAMLLNIFTIAIIMMVLIQYYT